jgi:hypothetical protein
MIARSSLTLPDFRFVDDFSKPIKNAGHQKQKQPAVSSCCLIPKQHQPVFMVLPRRRSLPLMLLMLLQSALIAASAFTLGGGSLHWQTTGWPATTTTTTTRKRTHLFADTMAKAGAAPPAADLLLGSTTEHRDNYDIVKVDLDDGRDYPIYIGTGYSDAEGACFSSASPSS